MPDRQESHVNGVGAVTPRPALFISHANPEDNAFTIWLAAKLAALGYEVWADVMRLRGGDDWQRKLENALRERARKVLLVANSVAVDKQGVRNEIQIASDVAKRVKDHEFIIPLRLGRYDAPFLIAHAQYINFIQGWAKGLAELLQTLEETYRVPKTTGLHNHIWREIQLIHGREVVEEPERLISNWLPIVQMPPTLRLYDFAAGIMLGQSKILIKESPWAALPYKRGFLAFAPIHELQDHFGPEFPLKLLGEHPTEEFLATGWHMLGIDRNTARRHFADLSRRAMDRFFHSQGLASFEMANDRLAWWVAGDLAASTKVSFDWVGISGQRQIQGRSAKRGIRWHFGVSTNVRFLPLQHVRVTSRLLFTEDGVGTFERDRMHRLRRSFAKGWRNERWRDMLLAFLWWLSGGAERLVIPTSANTALILTLPPMTLMAPVSVREAGVEPEEDDPSDPEDPDTFDEESEVQQGDEEGD